MATKTATKVPAVICCGKSALRVGNPRKTEASLQPPRSPSFPPCPPFVHCAMPRDEILATPLMAAFFIALIQDTVTLGGGVNWRVLASSGRTVYSPPNPLINSYENLDLLSHRHRG